MPPFAELPEKPVFECSYASSLWDELVDRLHAAKLLKAVDIPLLQSACEMWGLYRKCYVLANNDPTNKDCRIAVTAYWAKFEQAAARFGLNPSDRQRLRTETPTRQAIAARQRG
jgi:P27 family predicted phage terminase small subunit